MLRTPGLPRSTGSNNIPLLNCVTESPHPVEDSDRTCHQGQRIYQCSAKKTHGADLT